jgi:tetratricopeptide (TPR) repeat protein
MTSLLIDMGRLRDAIARVRRIDIQLSRNRIVHGVLAARAGDVASASAILVQLEAEAAERQAPRPASRVHQLRAEIALARRDTRTADEHATLAFKLFPTTWTLTTQARAQHAAGRTSDAIETWKLVLGRPGERTFDFDAPAYSQYVLARYELARLLEQVGRLDDARANYDEFLRFWERADPDLRVLAEARARRARLTASRSGQGAQSAPAGRVPKPAA